MHECFEKSEPEYAKILTAMFFGDFLRILLVQNCFGFSILGIFDPEATPRDSAVIDRLMIVKPGTVFTRGYL